MRTWWLESDIVTIAVVLACGLLVLKRFTSDRWKRRFAAIGSPLIESPGYRVLFLLVAIGALLIATLPEAAFVLPALDSVGLDIVTILAALELRHYLTTVARIAGMPRGLAPYYRLPARIAGRGRDLIRAHPVLWLYEWMWPVIRIKTLMGTMRVAPTAQL